MDAMIETRPRRAPTFTKENAGDYARKATIAREHNKRMRLAASGSPDSSEYIKARLMRLRVQLARIDAMIESELDPQKLDRLVSAQSRLAEQWRVFAGIPLPGSHRPSKPSTPKPSSIEPSE